MKLPTQPEKIDADRQALAPYNFVPLPEKVVTINPDDPQYGLPDQDCYQPDRLTGSLECTLTTSSPVYVRAGLPPEKYGSGQVPEAFFYVEDEADPRIPGSSLRGMLRSLVEIASYSKVSAIPDEKLIYRAIGDMTSHGSRYRDRLMRFDGERDRTKFYTPLVRGGYMVQRGSRDWAIRPAKEIGGVTYAHIKLDEVFFRKLHKVNGLRNASEVWIETGPYDYQRVKGGFLQIKYARVQRSSPDRAPGLRRATLARSGWMNSKRTEAVIYEPDDQAVLLPLKDEQIDAYRAQLSAEQEDLLGSGGVLKNGQPVFYVLDDDGQVFFFGHCRMFRIPYPYSPRDYVPEELRREGDLDMAEAIFGYTKSDRIPQGKRRSYAGRVFVSDARCLPGQDEIWLNPTGAIMPRILGGPKPTTFQHYLVQPTPNRKKIGQTRDGKPKFELRLADYAAPLSETVLRGHKLYWHKGEVGLDDIRENDPIKDRVIAQGKEKEREDKQHTRIRPLRKGVTFRFRIDFENLNEAELGALLWVLDIAADEHYRLKLGMGKPYGMGAVKIESELRLTDRPARYTSLFASAGWETGVASTEAGAETWRKAVAAFQHFVLSGLNEHAAQSLIELARIRSLLAMLSWPGPDRDKTRYLEIEREDRTEKRGKRNEYKERPVLPAPLEVWMGGAGESSSPKQPIKLSPEQAPLPQGYQRGVVINWGLGPNQSYGYIRPQKGGQDIFVHRNGLAKGVLSLQEGQSVIFRVVQGQKGLQAQDVRLDQ